MAKLTRRTKTPAYNRNLTDVALLIAAFSASCMFYTTETLYGFLRDSGSGDLQGLSPWRVHMGSACLAMVAFVITFFLLESLARKSRPRALRSTVPWSPLVAVTGVATVIHIPIVAVTIACAVYIPWAYIRTRAVY
jgi:hypothetical protein